MEMRILLAFVAIFEAATGVALILVPSAVAQMLLGAGIAGVAAVVARVAGIGLLALGVACWPRKEPTHSLLVTILTYNVLVTILFLYIGIFGATVGVLLWPATAVHAVLTVLLARGAHRVW
jgi:hypothetical protein